jgi:nitroreductase
MNIDRLLDRYSLGGKYLVEPAPNPHELELILKAALRAPDHAELMPFRFSIIQGESRQKLADLFENYAKAAGKSVESCQVERDRALKTPLSIAVIAKIDMSHPIVPAHEQWMCVGGAVTNILNAIHGLGYAGKILSGGKVRDQNIRSSFCQPGEVLVGWIAVGTPTRSLGTRNNKDVSKVFSKFD